MPLIRCKATPQASACAVLQRNIMACVALLATATALTCLWGGEPPSSRGAFRTPVPEDLVLEIQSRISEVREQEPLTDAAEIQLRGLILDLHLQVPSRREQYWQVYDEYGSALLPLIEKQLRDPESVLRRRALDALTPFLSRPQVSHTESTGDIELIVALLTRSLDDSEEEHRLLALGKSYGLARQVQPPLRDRIVAELARALTDSSDVVKEQAAFYLIGLGYADQVPEDLREEVKEKASG